MIAHTIVQACTHMHTFPHIQMHIYLVKKWQLLQISSTKANGITLNFPSGHCPPFDLAHLLEEGDGLPKISWSKFFKTPPPKPGWWPWFPNDSQSARVVWAFEGEEFDIWGCVYAGWGTISRLCCFWHKTKELRIYYHMGKRNDIKIWSYWSIHCWTKGKSWWLWRNISTVHHIWTPWGHLTLRIL